MTKRLYKHVKTGAVQYIDELLAKSFKDWQPTDEQPPCKDDYTKDEPVPFEPETTVTDSEPITVPAPKPTDEPVSMQGFVRLNSPADITSTEKSDKEAVYKPVRKRKKDLED